MATELENRVPVTLGLIFAATVFALLIAVPLGILGGLRPNGVIDRIGRAYASLAISIPSYVVATLLVSYVAVELDWAPPLGYTKFSESPAEWRQFITLPAISLGLAISAAITRQLRAALVDELDTNHIRTAWAIGGAPPRVVGRHGLKNASLPAITIVGLQITALVGGTVIIEQIFSIPGIGPVPARLDRLGRHPRDPGLRARPRADRDHDEPGRRHPLRAPESEDPGRGMTIEGTDEVLRYADNVPVSPNEAFAPAVELAAVPHRRGAFRRLIRRPGPAIALVYIVVLGLAAIFRGWVAPYDPNEQDIPNKFATPSWEHWVGTDNLGRDLLSRLIYGAWISLQVALFVVAIAMVVSLVVGLFSGYVGGRTDNALMRIVDGGLAFPPLVLAIAVAGILGRSTRNIILSLAVVFVFGLTRLVRGTTLAVREEPFVEASRAAGSRTHRILRYRILPNVRSPLIVAATFGLAGVLIAEAGLAYIGLGAPPPTASWGVDAAQRVRHGALHRDVADPRAGDRHRHHRLRLHHAR